MRFSQLPHLPVFVVGIFLAASFLAPLPYAVLEPGGGQDVLGGMINISSQKTYPTSGKLLLTTVYVTSPTSVIFGLDVLDSWFRGDAVVLPRSVLYPPDTNPKQINAINAADMANSQELAAAAALTYLKYPIGEKVVTDGSGNKTTKYTFPFEISISLKNTGGPSGGLVFALGIVEKLTPDDFLDGRTVAGTGTIDKLGNVGAIGGIDEKMIAARRAGATVFLAPSENCNDVAHIPTGLTVYTVATLAEAVAVLKDSHQAVAHCAWQRNR